MLIEVLCGARLGVGDFPADEAERLCERKSQNGRESPKHTSRPPTLVAQNHCSKEHHHQRGAAENLDDAENLGEPV